MLKFLKINPYKKEYIDYVVEHKYEPDFIKVINGQTILLEAKGRFWDYAEYSKYIWIRESLKDQVGEFELVFLFQKPYAPMPQAKKRKDGTKRSHAEWATRNGFIWFSEDSIPDEWIDANARKEDDKLDLEME